MAFRGYDVYHLVIPDTSNTSLLVHGTRQSEASAADNTLPKVLSPIYDFTCPDGNDFDDDNDDGDVIIIGSWNGNTSVLRDLVLKTHGLDLYFRDILWTSENTPKSGSHTILISDLRSRNGLPAHLSWLPRKELSNLSVPTFISQVDLLKLVYGDISAPNRKRTLASQPWRQQGWFADVEQWFGETLKSKSLGFPVQPGLIQTRNMHYSTVLVSKVQSVGQSGDSPQRLPIYLKCSSSAFTEVTITEAVASHFPGIAPNIIASRNGNTMILDSATDLTQVDHVNIMRAYGCVQAHSADQTVSLRASGVPYRGLDWHAEKFAELLHHPALAKFQGEEFFVNLTNRVNDFQTILVELASYRIPQTLVHGDLNMDNILSNRRIPQSPIIIDWASACISHPFIDFVRISSTDWDRIDGKAARDAYLKVWTTYESKENIQRALRIVFPLLLCDGLYIMLKQYDVANDVEQRDMVDDLGDRVSWLSKSIEEYLKSNNENLDGPHRYSIIIARNDGHDILTRQCGDMISLPVLSAFGKAGISHRALSEHGMRQLIRTQLGIDTRVVRYLWQQSGKSLLQKVAVVLEALDDSKSNVTDHKWVKQSDLKAFSGRSEMERMALMSFFDNGGSQPVISLQTPWRQFGWLGQVRKWLECALVRYGLKIVGGIHEVKTDTFSTVWTSNARNADKVTIGELSNSVRSVFVKSS